MSNSTDNLSPPRVWTGDITRREGLARIMCSTQRKKRKLVLLGFVFFPLNNVIFEKGVQVARNRVERGGGGEEGGGEEEDQQRGAYLFNPVVPSSLPFTSSRTPHHPLFFPVVVVVGVVDFFSFLVWHQPLTEREGRSRKEKDAKKIKREWSRIFWQQREGSRGKWTGKWTYWGTVFDEGVTQALEHA